MPSNLDRRIALRMKAIREERGLSQETVSRRLGFRDRQTLSAIEANQRRVSADELALAAEVFGVGVDYFTDAFRLEGEGEFSFRAGGVDAAVLADFQAKAGRWLATFRELSVQEGVALSRLGLKLELTRDSSFEDAWAAADELRGTWKLGDVPALNLASAIERELDTLVLHVDAPDGLSGASSRVPGLNAILINRGEPAGRRNFDLAHELFHLLTWDALTPERVEPREAPRQKGSRREQMAENFAAALLMPQEVVDGRWRARADMEIHAWLNASATALRVSAVALKWRMRNLGLLTPNDLARIQDVRLVAHGGELTGETPPPPFSSEFVRRVHAAVESGRLSLRRAAKLLGVALSEFADLCRQYGLTLSYDT